MAVKQILSISKCEQHSLYYGDYSEDSHCFHNWTDKHLLNIVQ